MTAGAWLLTESYHAPHAQLVGSHCIADRMSSSVETTLRIAIVDDPDTGHGRAMLVCAMLLGQLDIHWIEPNDAWPERLRDLENVLAVALPFSVPEDLPQATLHDMHRAIRSLTARDVPVFIAAGNRAPNPLAIAGTRVQSDFAIDGVVLPARVGTSGRAVLAAAQSARSRWRN